MDQLYQPQAHDICLSRLLYALADPSRLRMVLELFQRQEIASQAFSSVKAARGTIAFHLKTLHMAGITRTRIIGNRRLISLRRDELRAQFPGLLEAILGVPQISPSPHTGH